MEIKNLKKSFGKKLLYKDLSFQVDQGQIFALIGPNGVGKTTLMKMILGWDKDYQGQIRLQGQKKLAYSPESPDFPDFLTGHDLMEFFIKLRGSQDQASELLSLLGLEPTSKTLIKNYSKGMKQRLAVAQALVGDPDILLLDEPTAGLDYFGQRLIIDLLEKLKDQGKTIILNSHLLLDVEKVCDCGLILMGPESHRSFSKEDLAQESLGQMFMDLAKKSYQGGNYV
ncbi:MAG: ATP-binding cassette domain-containing protein [Bacillota bacterium]|nr:ATP-binding cassette domain-containing protein [Bacillota bacterium]